MTNEELSKQINELTRTVATMAETMHAKFEQIDQRFESIDEQLAEIRQDNKNLTDIVKDLELRMEARFAELHEGQAELRSSISDLRYRLFHEEGARETVDESIYQNLDKRLRLVEAKFPDLAQQSAA